MPPKHKKAAAKAAPAPEVVVGPGEAFKVCGVNEVRLRTPRRTLPPRHRAQVLVQVTVLGFALLIVRCQSRLQKKGRAPRAFPF